MKRYNVILTALMLTMMMVSVLLFEGKLKEYAFRFMVVIPIYFIILGSVTVGILQAVKGNGINMILGIKVLELVLSMILILAYIFIVKTNAVSFVVTFAIHFLVYIVYETYLMLDWNRKIKNKKN